MPLPTPYQLLEKSPLRMKHPHTPTPPPAAPIHVPDSVLDRLARVSSGSLTTTPNADNLQWVGVEQTQPGDVMVIDSRNDPAAASMGNMLITRMMQRGVRAVVTDGAFRDGTELAAMDLPVWSRGVTATTRLSYHRVADLQVPIACAGVAIYPGDVIHGDGDNVTVVPARIAAEITDLCETQDDLESYLLARMQMGEALWGIYPPSAATRDQYRIWVAAGRPSINTPLTYNTPTGNTP